MAIVDLVVEDHVAVVTLNRPEAMNAVDPEMRALLNQTWRRIGEDDDIWVAVVIGAGERAFCTGSDLRKAIPAQETPAQQVLGASAVRSLVSELRTDKPLIAAVNGYAMGGGLELALACDIRVCAEEAEFALTEVRVGSMPGAGGTVRLSRYIGRSDAMLMLLTGNRVDAAEALRMGLVSKVFPQAELLAGALEIARQIAANAPLSVRAVKRAARQADDMAMTQALDAERTLFALLYDSSDRAEGRAAFTERRKPVFKGR